MNATQDNLPLTFLLQASPIAGSWGRPLGRVPGVYLDITLQMGTGLVRFFAEAADVENRTEAFFLSASAAAYHFGDDGSAGSIWERQDINQLLKGAGLDCLMEKPRTVNYYFDAEDRMRGLASLGSFGSAAAIEFVCIANPTVRAMLYATPAFPCSVELATEPDRCDEIASSLQCFSFPDDGVEGIG